MLSLKSSTDKDLLIMSQRAFNSLANSQFILLEQHYELIPITIPTIEAIGGGSAGCMIAEIFLPSLSNKL
jgi:hypothetical protein